MNNFVMNGYFWKIRFVHPLSPYLVDRTGDIKLATTDPHTLHIYLSQTLDGDMLNRVLAHELGHCVMYSYGLLDEIHSMVPPEKWIDAEEWICNFVADYGVKIFSISQTILGDRAWLYISDKQIV